MTLMSTAFDMSMPGVFRLKGNGAIDHPFDPVKAGGDLSFSGALASLSDHRFSFLPIASVPSLSLNGSVDYQPGQASGDITVITKGGRLAADGSWRARPQDYDATIALDRFPVDAFMPSLGVGYVTARVSVDGRGYNPMAKKHVY